MSLQKFIDYSLSSWMNEEGPQSDIVLSSRVRLARNLQNHTFSTLLKNEEANAIINQLEVQLKPLQEQHELVILKMAELQSLEKRMLMEIIKTLPERERIIIDMRFGLGDKEELTQKEVADKLGISQSYISRLEKKIIKRIGDKLKAMSK